MYTVIETNQKENYLKTFSFNSSAGTIESRKQKRLRLTLEIYDYYNKSIIYIIIQLIL